MSRQEGEQFYAPLRTLGVEQYASIRALPDYLQARS